MAGGAWCAPGGPPGSPCRPEPAGRPPGRRRPSWQRCKRLRESLLLEPGCSPSAQAFRVQWVEGGGRQGGPLLQPSRRSTWSLSQCTAPRQAEQRLSPLGRLQLRPLPRPVIGLQPAAAAGAAAPPPSSPGLLGLQLPQVQQHRQPQPLNALSHGLISPRATAQAEQLASQARGAAPWRGGRRAVECRNNGVASIACCCHWQRQLGLLT